MANEGQEGFFQSVEIPKREIDIKLEILEQRINELKVSFEQYFLDLILIPPLEEQKQVRRLIRELQRLPFRQATHKFRLRNLQSRFNTYNTAWEKNLKRREEGTYKRDIFKSQMRKRMEEKAARARAKIRTKDDEMKELFNCYREALYKSGSKNANVDYDAFKKVVQNKATNMKKQHGDKKFQYQIAIKGGKVLLKTVVKE